MRHCRNAGCCFHFLQFTRIVSLPFLILDEFSGVVDLRGSGWGSYSCSLSSACKERLPPCRHHFLHSFALSVSPPPDPLCTLPGPALLCARGLTPLDGILCRHRQNSGDCGDQQQREAGVFTALTPSLLAAVYRYLWTHFTNKTMKRRHTDVI